jgi:hypothetical protein
MDLRTAQRILRGDDLKADAQRVIDARRSKRKRATQRLPRAPERPPEEPRAAKVERIRGAVFERAAGVCEFCATVPLMPVKGRPEEWHHCIGGPLRRELEAVENCAAICTECHRAYHRNDLDTLRSAATWAVEHEFRDAARTIARRLAKIEDVRAGRASLGKERVTR